MEREQFLGRVGTAMLTSQLPAPPRVQTGLPELDPVDLVELFKSRCQSVNGIVHGPVSRHGAPRVVAGIASGHDCSTFVAWDELPVSGVPSALTTAGLERIPGEVGDDRIEHNLGYSSTDFGVTGAIAGLAESGSLVLSHGPGRPRMASIVPATHVALLEVGRISRNLAHWAAASPDLVTETANLVFVTGPSRTGDIEQQLNLGVHGPRHVHVVLIK